jgi:integral membrane protein
MDRIFKNVAILEGISYLVLFSNMLFIKPTNQVLYKTLLYPIGMSHGILFIGYIILAVLIKKSQEWDLKIFLTVLIASLLPFATFFVEKKYLKNA